LKHIGINHIKSIFIAGIIGHTLCLLEFYIRLNSFVFHVEKHPREYDSEPNSNFITRIHEMRGAHQVPGTTRPAHGLLRQEIPVHSNRTKNQGENEGHKAFQKENCRTRDVRIVQLNKYSVSVNNNNIPSLYIIRNYFGSVQITDFGIKRERGIFGSHTRCFSHVLRLPNEIR